MFGSLLILTFGVNIFMDDPLREALSFYGDFSTLDIALLLIGSCKTIKNEIETLMLVNTQFKSMVPRCLNIINNVRNAVLKEDLNSDDKKLLKFNQKVQNIDGLDNPNSKRLKESIWINYGFYYYYSKELQETTLLPTKINEDNKISSTWRVIGVNWTHRDIINAST